jgi:hypothetical protein
MDIRKHAVSPTSTLELRDASDQLMHGVTVTLYGPGSKQYAKAQAAQSNRIMDKLKRKGKSEQTAEQAAAEKAEFLADCTESFANLEYDGLEGRALAVAVYSDVSIGFVADQVAAHIGDWSNFTKPSTTSL